MSATSSATKTYRKLHQLTVKLKPNSFSDPDQEIISDQLAKGNPYALTHVKRSGDTPFQCANTPPHPTSREIKI